MANTISVDDLNWEISKTIYVSDNQEFGLYSRELDGAKKLIAKTAREMFDSESDLPEHFNTVIGISGGRGSGKSSFLHMLERQIDTKTADSNNEFTHDLLEPENDGITFYSLGVVDPASLEANMSGLEILLTTLYMMYEKKCEEYFNLEKHADQTDVSMDVSDSTKGLYRDFKDLTKVLSSARIDASVYNSENPSIEILDHMCDMVEIRREIKKICVEVAKLCQKVKHPDFSNRQINEAESRLVLFIDDVDLIKESEVVRLLEDVRKYLSGSLVVVMAYREDQLIDAILDDKLQLSKRLINNHYVDREELQSQAVDFLEKILPSDRVIRLYTASNLMDEEVLKAFAPLSKSGNLGEVEKALQKRFSFIDEEIIRSMTVADWLDEAIYHETLIRVRPVYEQETTEYIWPRNLRELFTLGKIICTEMASPWKYDETASVKAFDPDQTLKNLGIYREYYLKRLNRAIGPDNYKIALGWLSADNQSKNYEAYRVMYDILLTSVANDIKQEKGATDIEKDILDNLLDIKLMLPENVTIGDVSALANILIRFMNGNDEIVHLVHSIKVLFSMGILECVLRTMHEPDLHVEDDEYGHKAYYATYSTLINACIFPPERNASRLSLELRIPKELDDRSVVKRILSRFSPISEVEGNRAFTASRPKRYMRLSRKDESPFGGHAMPLLANDDSYLAIDDPSDLGSAFQSKYLINPTNILGTYSFFRQAMEKACTCVSPCEHRKEEKSIGLGLNQDSGAYIFYSMFDIDVFASMPFGSRKSDIDNIGYLTKQFNKLMVAYSRDEDAYSEAGQRGARHYNRILKRLSAPFVFGPSPMFDEECIEDVDAFTRVLQKAKEREEAERQRIARAEAPDQLLFPSEKSRQKEWMNRAYDILLIEGSRDDIDSVHEILEDLQQPYRKLKYDQRKTLATIFQPYPRAVQELNELTQNE